MNSLKTDNAKLRIDLALVRNLIIKERASARAWRRVAWACALANVVALTILIFWRMNFHGC